MKNDMILSRFLFLQLFLLVACDGQGDRRPDFDQVPGTVIRHLPASTRTYLGSPSIVISPEGDYIVSMDLNSWDGERVEDEYTAIYRSADKGNSWEKLSKIKTQHWSSMFYHKEELYILGVKEKFSDLIIQRSSDGGKTWTEPLDENTGLIASGQYHCAPVPVVKHNGRIWRGIEVVVDGHKRKQALVMSAPIDSELLKSSNWTLSNYIQYQDEWREGTNGWIEGNVVVTPGGNLVNIIRLQTTRGSGVHSLAAMIKIAGDGKTISFDPDNGYINLPGGSDKKFTIRYDSISGKYWSLVNWIPPDFQGHLDSLRAGNIRNTLALVSSPNLKEWNIERIVLQHPDFIKHGFQYADWQIEGSDIVSVIRTGYDDGLGGPRDYHDANFITFTKVKEFRNPLLE
jgi:hypothetical protein